MRFRLFRGWAATRPALRQFRLESPSFTRSEAMSMLGTDRYCEVETGCWISAAFHKK